jgi:hypothetical protein
MQWKQTRIDTPRANRSRVGGSEIVRKKKSFGECGGPLRARIASRSKTQPVSMGPTVFGLILKQAKPGEG